MTDDLVEGPQLAPNLLGAELLRQRDALGLCLAVGMIRADLLKVFVTEGGISTPFNRTYVYRECPYIKLDVEFEPLGSRDFEGRVTSETNEDVIKKISKPYLEWSVMD